MTRLKHNLLLFHTFFKYRHSISIFRFILDSIRIASPSIEGAPEQAEWGGVGRQAQGHRRVAAGVGPGRVPGGVPEVPGRGGSTGVLRNGY